jgi:hypothetical protein
MGHFTVLNVSRENALKTAMQLRADLGIGVE